MRDIDLALPTVSRDVTRHVAAPGVDMLIPHAVNTPAGSDGQLCYIGPFTSLMTATKLQAGDATLPAPSVAMHVTTWSTTEQALSENTAL